MITADRWSGKQLHLGRKLLAVNLSCTADIRERLQPSPVADFSRSRIAPLSYFQLIELIFRLGAKSPN
jgi:hypothetical protein